MMQWKTTVAVIALSTAAWSQGEAPPLPQLGGGGDDPRAEMLELFKRVELRLREIDDLLYDASAGGSGVGDPDESGIGDLIRDSIDGSQQVLEDIDRIIEIAEQQSGTCSSTLSGSSESQSQSPSQSQQQQQGGQKESTPEAPKDGGEKPGEGQEGDEPHEQPDGQPQDPSGSDDLDPENRAGVDPPADDTERVRYVDDIERWGHLPVHVQEVFRSEGGGDLPPQYRDWIEAYYKRLNRAP